jgi:hypothetical protein
MYLSLQARASREVKKLILGVLHGKKRLRNRDLDNKFSAFL